MNDEKNLFAVFSPDGAALAELKGLLRELDEKYLSKSNEGTAKKLITFLKGINIGEYVKGSSGGTFSTDEGGSLIEVDNLVVRKRAKFKELIAEQLRHIGGQLVLSAADMTISRVETKTTYYRCYFETGDNGEITNKFAVGDLAKCQVFSGGLSKYYWRLVSGIGANYIDLSINNCDAGSSIPETGDFVAQWGHLTNKDRQSIQVLSSYGEDAPYWIQYEGINSYSTQGKELTKFTRNGNQVVGVLHLLAGSTGWKNLEGLKEEFESIAAGSSNLLLNSGFTGDYESADITEDTDISEDKELFSDKLKYWISNDVDIIEDSESTSGYAAKLNEGSLIQDISLIQDENYVLSFRAKGDNIKIFGWVNDEILLLNQYHRSIYKFKAGFSAHIGFSGNCTICDIQLEKGTIVSEWQKSYLDNDATTDKFKSLTYLLDAIKNGSTDILGGLILSNIIQLGNYENGILKNITAGISGIYNDETDPAFWAGGTFEQALKTILDPNCKDGSNVAISHSGRVIFLDAFIRGILASANGRNYINMLLPSFNFEDEEAGIELSFNKNGNRQIRTKNITVVSDSGAESRLPCFRNAYDPLISDYSNGDTVTHEGSSWRRLKAGPAGITPAEGEYWTKEAAKGENAYSVTISGDSVFAYPKDSNLPKVDHLLLTAALSPALSGYKWFYKATNGSWVSFNNETSTLTVSPSDTVNGINWINIWNGRKSLSIKATDGNDVANDIFNITKIYDGSDSLSVVMSNINHNIPAAPDGSVPTNGYSGSGSTLEVYEGANRLIFTIGVPSNGQYTIVTRLSPENSITPGAISGTGTPTATIADHSAMNVDKVVITYQVNGYTAKGENFILTPSQTIIKSKSGSNGNDALNVEISNQNFIVDWDGNTFKGTVTSIIKVLKGANFLEYGEGADKWQISITPSGIASFSGTPGTDNYTINFEDAEFASNTTVKGTLSLDITVNGITINKIITATRISKALPIYAGIYSNTAIYKGNVSRREIVDYQPTGLSYVTKSDAGEMQGVLPTNTQYWEPFDQYKNVATELLLAAQAFIKILAGNDIRVMDNADVEKIVATLTGSGNFPLFLGAETPEQANFKVDKTGKLTASQATIIGKILSSATGKRVEIDPSLSTIKFYDEYNRVCTTLEYYIQDSYSGQLILRKYSTTNSGIVLSALYVRPDHFELAHNSAPWFMIDITDDLIDVTIKQDKLPSSLPEISDKLWLDGNILKLGDANNTNAKHIWGKTPPPSIVAGSALGQGASVSIAGTDLAGRFTMVAGALPTPGQLCLVIFNTPYDQVPYVTITAANQNAANSIGSIWVETSTTGFTVHCDVDVDPNFEFNYNFMVIQ